MTFNNDEDDIWDDFEAASTDSYESIWNPNDSYYENCLTLIRRTLYHSESYTLAPILAAYTGFHSVAANFAPILFLSGGSGTGKSQLSLLIASIRGQRENILGGSSTFASIRNVLQQSRWKVRAQSPDEPQDTRRSNEKPCLLIWADIKAANLADPKMYGLLRNGTSREEDKLTIAGEAGRNHEFHVFAPKVLSSIEDFYNEAQYSELKRRILLVKTEKMKSNAISVDKWLESAINPSDYNWKGCSLHFKYFWDREKALELASLRKTSKLASKLKKLEWDSHHITAYSDLILQHIVLSQGTIKEVIETWDKYITIQHTWQKQSTVSVDSIVSQFTSHAEQQALEVDVKTVRIDHNLLHSRLVALKLRAYTEQISPIMQSKGYAPNIQGNILTWIKQLE